ncbi:MAG: hypothetical protein ACTHKL_08630 [Streptosporangiaceae bacterium]
MSITSDYPFEPERGAGASGGIGRRGSHASRPPGLGLLGALAILIASGLLGLGGGLLWTHVAPRAVYVVIARGSADIVNPETSAFITADAWFCLIGAVGGLIIGLIGYLLAVRRYGPVPMVAIVAGSVIAGIAARWIGEQQGLHQFDRQLLTVHQGTLLHAPLALAGDTKAAIWPPVASLPAVAFWPLAACVAAGGIVLFGAMRDRSAARSLGRVEPGPPQFPSYPGQ